MFQFLIPILLVHAQWKYLFFLCYFHQKKNRIIRFIPCKDTVLYSKHPMCTVFCNTENNVKNIKPAPHSENLFRLSHLRLQKCNTWIYLKWAHSHLTSLLLYWSEWDSKYECRVVGGLLQIMKWASQKRQNLATFL